MLAGIGHFGPPRPRQLLELSLAPGQPLEPATTSGAGMEGMEGITSRPTGMLRHGCAAAELTLPQERPRPNSTYTSLDFVYWLNSAPSNLDTPYRYGGICMMELISRHEKAPC